MNEDPTGRILLHDESLTLEKYGVGYHHFIHRVHGEVGIDAEEGEFLYSLVRMLKPKTILETGTNIGISTRYMVLGLVDNERPSRLFTVEHNRIVREEALVKTVPFLNDMVGCCFGDGEVEDLPGKVFDEPIDLLFLDTELAIRYGELTKFWPHLRNRGIACIHDMPQPTHELFGPIPEWLETKMKNGRVGRLSFDSIHGLSVFQKHTGALV